MSQKFIDSVMCPECGCTHINHDYFRGENVCTNCGMVLEDLTFEDGLAARGFDSNGSPLAAPPVRNTCSGDQGSLMGPVDKGVSASDRTKYRRLYNLDRRMRIRKASERSTAEAMRELNSLSAQFCIPPIVKEDAAEIYRKAARKKLVRGRSIRMVLASSIYIAFRRKKYPRTFEEISKMLKVDKRGLARDYKLVSRELRIHLGVTDPVLFLPRFCSTLEFSPEVRNKAMEILEDNKRRNSDSGMMPVGTAAAALYLASLMLGEVKTQKVFCAATGVTEVTLRNRSRQIDANLGLGLI